MITKKDDWLVCAVAWPNVLCEKAEAGQTVAALGIVVLCWLSVRTFFRWR